MPVTRTRRYCPQVDGCSSVTRRPITVCIPPLCPDASGTGSWACEGDPGGSSTLDLSGAASRPSMQHSTEFHRSRYLWPAQIGFCPEPDRPAQARPPARPACSALHRRDRLFSPTALPALPVRSEKRATLVPVAQATPAGATHCSYSTHTAHRPPAASAVCVPVSVCRYHARHQQPGSGRASVGHDPTEPRRPPSPRALGDLSGNACPLAPGQPHTTTQNAYC